MTCATCDTGLLHCHALAVRHDDGTWSCLDGCGGPPIVHDDTVACADIDIGCCQGQLPAPLDPALAA